MKVKSLLSIIVACAAVFVASPYPSFAQYAPNCTSVSPGSGSISAGGSTTFTANCSGGGTYSWPPPVTVPSGGNAGSNTDGSTSTTTYNAPGAGSVCSNTTISQSVTATNGFGSDTVSGNVIVTPRNTLSGTVYVDSASNDCTSGATAYTATSATISVNDVPPTTTNTNSSNGTYTLTDTKSCGTKTASISGISAGYTLESVQYQGGSWTSPTAPFSYTFDFSGNRALNWCLSPATSWVQIGGGGDTRTNILVDDVPGGQSGATDSNSTFFSSNSTANFGGGSAGAPVVNNEFGYNSDPRTHSGFFSYTFFMNRARVLGVALTDMTTICSNLAACDLTGLTSGKVYWANGNLTINSYSHPGPAGHVLILVNGTLTIKGKILVPAASANLLVIATKDNITLDRTLGETASGLSPDIQTILTSEKSVILDGTKCAGGNPDLRLNFEGSIVTNSLKPFATGGFTFVNNRSLCANDANYPALTIKPRFDFVPQLTDFYKVPSIRWKEIAP